MSVFSNEFQAMPNLKTYGEVWVTCECLGIFNLSCYQQVHLSSKIIVIMQQNFKAGERVPTWLQVFFLCIADQCTILSKVCFLGLIFLIFSAKTKVI